MDLTHVKFKKSIRCLGSDEGRQLDIKAGI